MQTNPALLSPAAASDFSLSPQVIRQKSSIARIIVVAVDETRGSTTALQFTIDSIFKPGDIIWLLHAMPGHASEVPFDQLIMGEDRFKEMKESIKRRIANVYGSLLEEKKIPYSISILTVSAHSTSEVVAHALCSHAEELNASMLVMSKHNQSAMKELFTGSVTASCIRRSKVPVLVFAHTDNLS